MKLILTREVSGLGGAGDVVTVKDGYGRNFLLARGSAIMWTKGGEGQIEGIKRARTTREIRDLDHAKEIKTKLEKANVIVKVKVGATGSMFGSVTDKAIVAAILFQCFILSVFSIVKILFIWLWLSLAQIDSSLLFKKLMISSSFIFVKSVTLFEQIEQNFPLSKSDIVVQFILLQGFSIVIFMLLTIWYILSHV